MKTKLDEMFTTVKVETPITNDLVRNLLVCAVEGGSNYWCSKIRPLDKDDKRGYDEYMLDGFYAVESESHDDKPPKRKVSKAKMIKAFELMEKDYHRHMVDALDESRMDADTGDVYLQLCCFGDVIYG